MKKELIICIIIFIIIILGNVITQKYTKESVENLSKELESLKIDINDKIGELQEENRELLNKNEKIKENWDTRHDKLAYYIEHNELEKVEDSLICLNSLLNTKEYGEAVKELDKCVFILKHIEEKYAFNLQNIF